MLATLEQIKNIIENDPVVSALVSKYTPDPSNPDESYPAVAFMTVPNDMDMPYVVTRVETNIAEDNDILKRMVYNIDVFADNGDIVTADKIARRIEYLLHRERLPLDLGIGIWKDVPPTIIPEDDPGVMHYFQRFIVRHL